MVNCYTKEKHTTDFPLLDFNSKLKSKTQMLVPVFIKKKDVGLTKALSTVTLLTNIGNR